MDNIQLYYIDNEINKIDKMKQGDVIYKNGVELLVVLSYDHNEPCKGCFFYEDKACGSERLIKCWGGVTKILDTNIHESGRCGNGSGSRERNDRDSGLRGGKGLPACGDRPSIL